MTLMTFRLPRAHLPGVTPRAISRMERQKEVVKSAALEGWKQGFSREAATEYFDDIGASLPTRPSDPEMPNDITTISNEDLGMLHGQFTAYTAWLESELALCEMDAAEAESYQEHVQAEIRLVKAGTVQDKTAKTLNDERFISAEQAALVAKAKARLLKARVSGYSRCSSALSREMTRRQPQNEPT